MKKDNDDRTTGIYQPSLLSGMIAGIGLLLASHVVAAIALAVIFYSSRWLEWYLVASVALGALVLFGITQVVYAIPLALWLQKRRRFKALKGVAIGSIITILLNIGVLFYIARLANLSV